MLADGDSTELCAWLTARASAHQPARRDLVKGASPVAVREQACVWNTLLGVLEKLLIGRP
jgi:hypothetical protein